MIRRYRFVFFATIVLTFVAAGWTQTSSPATTDASSFPPFQQWMGAVLTGDASTLTGLYSNDPPAEISIKTMNHTADADTTFWLDLKVRSMKADIVRLVVRPERASIIFRAAVVAADGRTLNVTDAQGWQKQGEQWRIVGVERTDNPQLKQPSDMKKDIYPASANARAEIKDAEQKAAKDHKRLLLVFGANWCFDCHVLDLAFHGPDLSSVVTGNYEVVHIDLGPDEKKNLDLVKEYDIPLDKGIPALAVAESDGKLLVSQKNGEFEDARGLTPDALAEFLNKWKPQAR
jgi:thioredoxin 1